MLNKKVSIIKAAKIIQEKKDQNFSVGLCHGTFDYIHLGHIQHFQEARSSCDYLCVSITPDKYVIKGKGRPFYTETERVEFLKAISYIDLIIVNEQPDSVQLIKTLKPSIYFKGPDYNNKSLDPTGMIEKEVQSVEVVNGKFQTTSLKNFSSTEILSRLKEIQ